MAHAVSASQTRGTYLYHRHSLPVRLMHWTNVVALTILFMSGLNIFDAHPSLQWGKSSYNGKAPVLEITSVESANGEISGVTRILGHEFDTTGVLGASENADGEMVSRSFPSWLMIPGNRWLSMARLWHLFFAWVLLINGIAFVSYALGSRHLSRDLLPDGTEVRGIGQSIRDHIRFRHPSGEAAKRYNVLQKIAYLVIIFVVLPLIILMGLAMSPGIDALWPGWVDLFGGRQAARTLHFILAWTLVAFVLIHVFEVIVSGFWNHMRSMITGRYRISAEEGEHDAVR